MKVHSSGYQYGACVIIFICPACRFYLLLLCPSFLPLSLLLPLTALGLGLLCLLVLCSVLRCSASFASLSSLALTSPLSSLSARSPRPCARRLLMPAPRQGAMSSSGTPVDLVALAQQMEEGKASGGATEAPPATRMQSVTGASIPSTEGQSPLQQFLERVPGTL